MPSKIRTTLDLNDSLDKHITWRKKELIYIRTVVEKQRGKSVATVLIRTAMPILYAHWEGFVKNAATDYLEFVDRQNKTYQDLSPNFIALGMKRKLNEAHITNKATVFVEAMKFITDGLSNKCSLQWKESIDTYANLNSSVLQEILCILGLDYLPYKAQEKFIDERLLKNRNEIAHGEDVIIDMDQYVETHQKVIDLMELLKNQIQNAATSKQYLAVP
jgi:hypothetical protein